MSLTLTRNDLSNEFDEVLASDSVITPEFAVSGVVRALVSHFGSAVLYKEGSTELAPVFSSTLMDNIKITTIIYMPCS